jgi:hypothetical protein
MRERGGIHERLAIVRRSGATGRNAVVQKKKTSAFEK